MESENRIKTLLSDVDKEFQEMNSYQRARFAIEQISMWQQRFNDAKINLKEYIVDATPAAMVISSYPEIEA